MAVTHGQGNPNWTRDETILALALYFECKGNIPSGTDERVRALSDTLRLLPYHSLSARKESFRNPDGIAFKLQNLRQVATGKGLGNVSRMDRDVWAELGNEPQRTKELANLIRAGIEVVGSIKEETEENEIFAEGRVVTEAHVRRERDPKIRKRLIEQRRKSGALTCEICSCIAPTASKEIEEAMFEGHHVIPLSVGNERVTNLKDMALLCANCHRMIHRAIVLERRWLSIEEAKSVLMPSN